MVTGQLTAKAPSSLSSTGFVNSQTSQPDKMFDLKFAMRFAVDYTYEHFFNS